MSNAFEPVSKKIRDRLTKSGIASLALAVAKDGEVVWQEGFGWANRESRMPSDPHVLYSLASITKPITATALMVLVERGDIDLDAPANEYLGESKLRARVGVSESGDFPDPVSGAAKATIRHLANHTSGLPLHYQFFHEDEPYIRPSMDESILRYGNLVTFPGERYQYANFGFGILDYIIERVSGHSYADFVRGEVFHPLGMTRAAIDIPPSLTPYAAERYDASGKPIPFYTFDHPGASTAWCSAHDLVRFGMFHLKSHLADQRAILTDATIDHMQIPTTPPLTAPAQGTARSAQRRVSHSRSPALPLSRSAGETGYGIGWRIIANNNGYQTVSHDGSMGGVRTRLMLVPKERIAVAVLTNGRGELPGEICDDVIGSLLPRFGKAAQAAHKKADRSSVDDALPFMPDESLIGTWRGHITTWVRDLPFELTIRPDGEVHARIGDALAALVNKVRLTDSHLTGVFVGDIRTDDAAKLPYNLHLDLNVRWNVLNGAVCAISLPSDRLGNALSHWCELERH